MVVRLLAVHHLERTLGNQTSWGTILGKGSSMVQSSHNDALQGEYPQHAPSIKEQCSSLQLYFYSEDT